MRVNAQLIVEHTLVPGADRYEPDQVAACVKRLPAIHAGTVKDPKFHQGLTHKETV